MLDDLFRKLGEALASAAHPTPHTPHESPSAGRGVRPSGRQADRSPIGPTTIASARVPARRGETLPPRPPAPIHREATTSVRRPATSVRWYGAGETLSVGPYSIREPFTYGAPRVPPGRDRACIDFSLPVVARGATSATSSAPFVSYRDLTAPERGAYLRWLAAGRTRLPDHPAFMTMFVEGIERRLLLDKCDGNVLAGELVRLLPLCPADDGARMLIYKLLAYATAVHHVTDIPRPSLELLVDQLDVKNNMTVDVAVLGWLSAWQKPIPAAWAWRLLWRLRVPQKLGTTREFARHRDAFVAAFARRFPEGFVLPLPPATRLISYYPSSHAVLEHFGWSACPPVLVPDALSSDQVTPLLTLWRTTVGTARDRKAAGPTVATAPPAAAPPIRVSLDPRAVRRVLADTRDAQRLLADVFADEQEDCQAQPPSVAHSAPGKTEEDQYAGLPPRYQPVLQALLEQADWERPAFVALVRRHRLMPDDTVAAINTWAEDALGDLLIEDTGSLHVNRRLVETRE